MELAMGMFQKTEDYWKARANLAEQVVADVAKELGCERDNEAILMALHELKEDAVLRQGSNTLIEIIGKALSRAEQAKQETETCVWSDNNGQTECGATPHGELLAQMDNMTFCPFCSKRIEVKK